MSGNSNNLRSSVKTGDTLKWTQSLTDPTDVAAVFPNGLLGITVFAQLKDRQRGVIFTTAMQSLTVDMTEFTIRIPSTHTLDLVVGEFVVMDFLYSDGTTNGMKHSDTIKFLVKEGITQNSEVPVGAGGFEGSAYTSGFQQGPIT